MDACALRATTSSAQVPGRLAGLTIRGRCLLTAEARQLRLTLHGAAGGPKAVCAAWREVLVEFADHRVAPPGGETVPNGAASSTLSRAHDQILG